MSQRFSLADIMSEQMAERMRTEDLPHQPPVDYEAAGIDPSIFEGLSDWEIARLLQEMEIRPQPSDEEGTAPPAPMADNAEDEGDSWVQAPSGAWAAKGGATMVKERAASVSKEQEAGETAGSSDNGADDAADSQTFSEAAASGAMDPDIAAALGETTDEDLALALALQEQESEFERQADQRQVERGRIIIGGQGNPKVRMQSETIVSHTRNMTEEEEEALYWNEVRPCMRVFSVMGMMMNRVC